MAKTNKEIVNHLENEAVIAAWDKGEDDSDPDCKVVRCKDCIYHEPFPDASHRDKNSVYCSTFDLVKWKYGFCEAGIKKEEN